ncbi:hypothetical protein [Streptomyces rimosus]|uniref:hypothetical protein n=1 Tax=Streptomyces rimosus TaxID=1927 RepID=UPI00131DBAA4|nr:hypothetical protein [Streptomyces rimosus]
MPTTRARTCIRACTAVWAAAGVAAMLIGVPATAWLSGSYWTGLVLGEAYFLAQALLAAQAFRTAGRSTAQALRWVAGSLAWAGLPLWLLATLAWLNADTSDTWADVAPRTTAAGATCLLLTGAAWATAHRLRARHHS